MTGFAGGCLCGAVKYSATTNPKFVINCYCEDCRLLSGSSHCTLAMTSQHAVEIKGPLKNHPTQSDGGRTINHYFCSNCGSGIYNTNPKLMPGKMAFHASSISTEHHGKIKPTVNLYASRAPEWANIDKTLPTFDEMPPAAPETRGKKE